MDSYPKPGRTYSENPIRLTRDGNKVDRVAEGPHPLSCAKMYLEMMSRKLRMAFKSKETVAEV